LERVNIPLLTQAVRVYRANQRQGSAKTKTRGEVRGSTRKIYRQKGTGRARHGGIRAPIFVGGGIVFGPQIRDYSLKLTKKMKAAALRTTFYLNVKNNQVNVVDGLESLPHKTKSFASAINRITKSTNVLLIIERGNGIKRFIRNIPFIHLSVTSQLNPYELLAADQILFTRGALNEFFKHVQS
ncbi:50S ribosomal protein L4, partial [Candidatus Gottesmanbacteria bacterium RBG_16_43_7]